MALFIRVAAAVVLCLISNVSRAQSDKPSACAIPQVPTGAPEAGDAGARRGAPPIKPYTMKQTETQEQDYANGVTYTHKSEIQWARNSAGWTRTEFESDMGGGKFAVNGKVTGEPIEQSIRVSIYFNAAGKSLSWMEGPRQPHVATLSVRTSNEPIKPPPQTRMSQDDKQGPIAQQTNENLGTKTIEGVIVTGGRTTTAFPANFHGNNLPYREVAETWFSADYRTVFERTLESSQGRSHMIVSSFTPGEPDVALFQPPSDYTISCQITTVEKNNGAKP